MIGIRLFQAPSLALLAGILAAGTADATMPGSRPSVSVPPVSVRPPSVPTPKVDVPRDIRGKQPAGGSDSSASKGTSGKTGDDSPNTYRPWNPMAEALESYQKHVIAPQQKKIDNLYAQLQAAGAAVRGVDPDDKKTGAQLRDRWEKLFEQWKDARAELADMQTNIHAKAGGWYRDNDSDHGADWVTWTGIVGVGN